MFNISTQANFYTIVLVITSVINMILTGIIYGPIGIGVYILLFVLLFPFLLLGIYDIDCLTTGGCNIWSWIVTILSTLSMIVVTILMVVAAVTGKGLLTGISIAPK